MFTEYFHKKSLALTKSLKAALKKQGVKGPGKKKDPNLFKDFYTFLREHLPEEYKIATGKVRNKKHLLNRSCDVLIYNKWCEKYLELTGGYVLADSLYAFLSLDTDANKASLQTHLNMSRALKSLYAIEKEIADHAIIPVYSVQICYTSRIDLPTIVEHLSEISKAKEIPNNQQCDMVVVLDKGIVVKDYEEGGSYKAIATEKDTLMWFYILFMEYLDRDGKFKLDLRDYIKQDEEYSEA